MLIWKGHGILILVFGILGGLLMGFGVAFLSVATHWELLSRMVGPANAWGAALAIWLYGKTMGKTVLKTYMDPATQRPVVLKTSHTLFFIPALPWAVLVAAGACLATVRAFNQPAEDFMSDAQLAEKAPGKAAFKEANRLIDADKGKTAYGNTPDAERLAAAFSQMVMMGREMGVQKTKKKSMVSLSHGKFLSYCRINPDSCVFMVHVPDLRKFSDDAKRYMVEMAWTVAGMQAAQLKPRPQRLVVGVRGAFLYDEVVEGPVPDAKALAASETNEDWQAGIERRYSGSDATSRLQASFEPHAAGAVLPVLAQADEPEGMAASAPPKTDAAPASAAAKTAKPPQGKLEVMLEWFPTTKAGQVAANDDSVNPMVLKYAGRVHDRVSVQPALGGMTLPDPSFSAYIHLRDDTAAFLLALPPGSGLPEAMLKVIGDEAWMAAATAAAHFSPLPTHIAVIFFNEGEMIMTRVGSPSNKQGTEWLVEQERSGKEGRELLAPFVAECSKPLMTVKSPLSLQPPVKSMLAANRHVKAAQPVPAAPAAAPTPAPAPLLPTAVRDWKDATGRVMQASLEGFTTPAKDAGRFKRADGQVFEVPFARLSAEDQAFISQLAAPQKP